ETDWGRFDAPVRIVSLKDNSAIIEIETEIKTVEGNKRKEKQRFQIMGEPTADWKPGERRKIPGVFAVVGTKTIEDREAKCLRIVNVSPEQLAAESLDIAKRMIHDFEGWARMPDNNKARLVKTLKHIVGCYPMTKAAEEARKILDSPDK